MSPRVPVSLASLALLLILAPPSSAQPLSDAGGAVVALDHRVGALGVGRSADTNRYDGSARTAGFLIDQKGHIVTRPYFVRSRSTIRIRLAKGIRARARVVGIDSQNNIAVLKLENARDVAAKLGGKLPTLSWGSSLALRVGHTVFTIGNTYGSLALDGQPSLSRGVVTSLGRLKQGSYRGVVIETDAAVNPGSFGGPLLNRSGQVVGVVGRGFSSRRWLGTAVPSDQVRFGVDALIAGQPLKRGRLGLALRDTGGEASRTGLEIMRVLPDSAASRAGIKAGERLVSIDGNSIYDTGDVARELESLPPGSPITLRLLSGQTMRRVRMILDAGEILRVAVRPRPTRPDPRPDTRRGPPPESKVSLGVRVEERSLGIGLKVVGVQSGSAADLGGIKKDDVLIRIGEKRVNSLNDLSWGLSAFKPGDRTRVVVYRDRRARMLSVRFGKTTGARPDPRPDPRPKPGTGKPGYLGVFLDPESSVRGAPLDGTSEGSPAARAGLRKGDVVVAVNGRAIRNTREFIDFLKGGQAGDKLRLTIRRRGWSQNVEVVLAARGETPTPTPRPTPPSTGRPWLGAELTEDQGVIRIQQVNPRGPLARFQLGRGDAILRMNGRAYSSIERFAEAFGKLTVGQTIQLVVERDGWTKTISVRLPRRP